MEDADYTDYYINRYLLNKKDVLVNINAGRVGFYLKGRRCLDVDKVAKVITSMPYQEFLQTPYWKGVARVVKLQNSYGCQKCGMGGLLNVHHITYKHHGLEIYHLEDLECLCSECHKRLHEELAEQEEQEKQFDYESY